MPTPFSEPAPSAVAEAVEEAIVGAVPDARMEGDGEESRLRLVPPVLRCRARLAITLATIAVVLLCGTALKSRSRLGSSAVGHGTDSRGTLVEPDAVRRLREYRRAAAAKAAADKLRKRAASASASISKRSLQGVPGLPEPEPVCEDATRWDQMQWEVLSDIEKNSWLTLGWLEDDWNAAHPIPSVSEAALLAGGRLLADGSQGVDKETRRMQELSTTPTTTWPKYGPQGTESWRPPPDYACYQHLQPDQQDAVKTLGYNIETWHACKNPTCPWPADIPRYDAPCRDQLLYLEVKYNATPTNQWYGMTVGTKNALMELGYDEHGRRFTKMNTPPVYAKPLSSLSPREVEAAMFLGYTEKTWGRCVEETPCIIRMQDMEAKEASWRTPQTGWKNMLRGIRSRLEELGWSERSWTEGEPPAPMQLAWIEVPYSQRIAAQLLGYTEDTWSRCPNTPCLARYEYVKNKYQNKPWIEMTEAQKRAWMLLEHSSTLWEEGKNPPSMQLKWMELSAEQRRQAEFLGHSEGTWEGCGEKGDDDPVVQPGEDTSQPLDPDRVVRARMKIQRPFSEISGNVYGAQVADLPTSFIEVFERSIARSLFCGNPALSDDPMTYVDANGEPACTMRVPYEQQRPRIKVVTVVEGSIIVDFYIMCAIGQAYSDGVCQQPQPAGQATAAENFYALQKALTEMNSPINMDMEFGRFANVATIEEVAYQNLEFDMMQKALDFEQLRGQYNANNACELGQDFRLKPSCRRSAAHQFAPHGAALFLAMATLFL